ncbi:MAG: serine/threonine protein kinase [bacterium]|nr:serine/threonine protein kinase [bacterium]
MTLVGTTVGRIRVVEPLGKGGMGEVYVGFDETLKRKVALKAIRDERRLDAEAKARFLREARILSQLDHPGICRIHEFIEGDDLDFLVLELIPGKGLKQVLEEEDLAPAFKLHVAEQVTEVLVAAHAQGIAHRDLKPENVMLTPEGEVKVLDFGLAYTVDVDTVAAIAPVPRPAEPAADPEAPPRVSTEVWSGTPPTIGSRKTRSGPVPRNDTPSDFVQTQRGTVMGTVAYMSPEQARGERVTVAGDMYSLGLMLQELFTGTAPYDPELPLLEMLSKVGNASTREVTGIDPDLAELIERLKSLAPEARPSAVETAERLRWIRGKPGRRLLRRLVAFVVLALVFGGVKYTYDLRRERNLAIEASREAEQARQIAEAASLEAEVASHQAREVSDFLLDLFEVSDPQEARGEEITALELLDAGAARIGELRGQPLSQSRLMLTMGRVYRKLGSYEQARDLLEEALEIRRRELGEDHLETAVCLDLLASLYHDQGDYEGAEPLYRRALEIREISLGPDHQHVAASLNNLAFLHLAQGQDEPAEPLLLRALEIQRKVFGEDHPDLATSLVNLGDLYRGRGQLERAEPFLRRALEVQEKVLHPDDPSLTFSLNNLAMVVHEQGFTARAVPLFRRSLEIQEKVLGADHPNVATGLNNLAELYRVTGEYDRAEPLYRRALAIQEEALGKTHPAVAITLSNLADLLNARGETRRAIPLYRRAVTVQEHAFDRDHPSVAVTLNHLADAHQTTGKYPRAEPLYRRALAIQETAFGDDHPSVAITLADLADLRARQGRYAEAKKLYLRSQASTRQALAQEPDSRAHRHRLAATRVGLGRVYLATGAPEQAADAWARAETIMKPLTAGSDNVAYLHTHTLALLHLANTEEAQPMVEILLAKGWAHPDFLELCRRNELLEPEGADPVG